MGIPVITNSGVGDVKEIVEKYRGGIVLDDFSETAMRNVADDVCNNKTVFNAHEIRQGAIDFYNLEKTLETYKKVYREVLG